MAGFNLADYETANSTIKRYWTEFPTGRINPVIEDMDLLKGFIFIRTEIYKDYAEPYPTVVDYAYGNVAFYPENMKKWFVEDTVTSSISRAIKLLTPSDARPSLEDMKRVDHFAEVPFPKKLAEDTPRAEFTTLGEAVGELGEQILDGTQSSNSPQCSHGFMLRKEGINSKTNKPFKGFVCSSKDRNFQCKPIWEMVK